MSTAMRLQQDVPILLIEQRAWSGDKGGTGKNLMVYESGDTEYSVLRKAVRQFACAAYVSLARKAIWKLQWIPATRIFDDDYGHRTLWDEYCHEKQSGSYYQLESAWDSVQRPVVQDIVLSLRQEELVILSCDAFPM